LATLLDAGSSEAGLADQDNVGGRISRRGDETCIADLVTEPFEDRDCIACDDRPPTALRMEYWTANRYRSSLTSASNSSCC
jgi:hypothetical protein